MSPRRARRILFVSHGHPALSKGGGEIAAYRNFRRAVEEGAAEARFLSFSGTRPQEAGAPLIVPLQPGEYDCRGGGYDEFLHTSTAADLAGELVAFLQDFAPDIVHAHHYLRSGVQLYPFIRSQLPQTRIVLTMHEYLLICHNQGQLVKSKTLGLCHGASPAACHSCFPEFAPNAFAARRAWLQHCLGFVDAFVAPSRFLAGRYVEWGLPPRSIFVIPNLPGHQPPPPPRGNRRYGGPLRIGYFGQVSQLKGVLLVLEALQLLKQRGSGGPGLWIFGTTVGQSLDFTRAFADSCASLADCVTFCGPYDNARTVELMQDMDFIVVPSLWWENAPLVLQEARLAGVPVIGSDIGGIREAIVDGQPGLLFPVGDPAALADLLQALAEGRVMPPAPDNAAAGEDPWPMLLSMYQSLAPGTTESPHV